MEQHHKTLYTQKLALLHFSYTTTPHSTSDNITCSAGLEALEAQILKAQHECTSPHTHINISSVVLLHSEALCQQEGGD